MAIEGFPSFLRGQRLPVTKYPSTYNIHYRQSTDRVRSTLAVILPLTLRSPIGAVPVGPKQGSSISLFFSCC